MYSTYIKGFVALACGVAIIGLAINYCNIKDRLEQKSDALDMANATIDSLLKDRAAANKQLAELQKRLVENEKKYTQTVSEISELKQKKPAVAHWCDTPIPNDLLQLLTDTSTATGCP